MMIVLMMMLLLLIMMIDDDLDHIHVSCKGLHSTCNMALQQFVPSLLVHSRHVQLAASDAVIGHPCRAAGTSSLLDESCHCAILSDGGDSKRQAC